MLTQKKSCRFDPECTVSIWASAFPGGNEYIQAHKRVASRQQEDQTPLVMRLIKTRQLSHLENMTRKRVVHLEFHNRHGRQEWTHPIVLGGNQGQRVSSGDLCRCPYDDSSTSQGLAISIIAMRGNGNSEAAPSGLPKTSHVWRVRYPKHPAAAPHYR